MKASLKRMIWFFGFNMWWTLDSYIYWLIHGVPFEVSIQVGITLLLMLVVPLFFFEDDKEKKK